MDIGSPQRVVEIEPVTLPVPEPMPDLEPAPDPTHEDVPERAR